MKENFDGEELVYGGTSVAVSLQSREYHRDVSLQYRAVRVATTCEVVHLPRHLRARPPTLYKLPETKLTNSRLKFDLCRTLQLYQTGAQASSNSLSTCQRDLNDQSQRLLILSCPSPAFDRRSQQVASNDRFDLRGAKELPSSYKGAAGITCNIAAAIGDHQHEKVDDLEEFPGSLDLEGVYQTPRRLLTL
eukprot:6178630-Pleurochrysis_carterae.AAC.3